MLHKIEDEDGQHWCIGNGDPAYGLVQKLHSRHYTWIVLPRAIITGSIKTFGSGRFGIRRALQSARQMGYNSEGGRRQLRLAECLLLLGERHGAS